GHVLTLQARHDRAHAIVGPRAAALSYTEGAEWQVHVVVDDQALVRLEAEKVEQRFDRCAAAVHERLRLGQDHCFGIVPVWMDDRDQAVPRTGLVLPGRAMAAGELLDAAKAQVVPRIG